MKKIKPTVSIGIAAYNEAANIGNLLTSLLSQNTSGFVLEKIIIRTDAPTDNTNNVIKSFTSKKIHLLIGKERLGKALGVNIITKVATSDILINLDADVVLKNANTLSNLVLEFEASHFDLAGVKIRPLSPTTPYEDMLYFSTMFKSTVFEDYNFGDNWYTCSGAARLMRKNFYKKIHLLKIVGEDLYSYMFAKKENFSYGFLRTGTVYYRLSTNLSDHRKQNARFATAREKLQAVFGAEFFADHFVMPKGRIFQVLLTHLFTDPIKLFSFAFVLTAFSLKDKFVKPNIGAIWSLAESTKK